MGALSHRKVEGGSLANPKRPAALKIFVEGGADLHFLSVECLNGGPDNLLSGFAWRHSTRTGGSPLVRKCPGDLLCARDAALAHPDNKLSGPPEAADHVWSLEEVIALLGQSSSFDDNDYYPSSYGWDRAPRLVCALPPLLLSRRQYRLVGCFYVWDGLDHYRNGVYRYSLLSVVSNCTTAIFARIDGCARIG